MIVQAHFKSIENIVPSFSSPWIQLYVLSFSNAACLIMSKSFHWDRLAENEIFKEKGVSDHGGHRRMALPCQFGLEHGAMEPPHKWRWEVYLLIYASTLKEL